MSILRGPPTKKCAPKQALVPALLHRAQGRRTTGRMRVCVAPSLRVAARTVGCIVALLDHIDIWPSSGASHPVRPGHNASRAWL